MATRLKPVGHEDRLSLVEHLDELRTRIIFCLVVFTVCFAVCMWQDDFILDTVNRPLAHATQRDCDTFRQDPLEQSVCWQQSMKALSDELAQLSRSIAASASDEPALQRQAGEVARAADRAVAATPRGSPRRPVTLGVGEPFTATITVAAYAAILISMPLLLYQLYAFVLPAFSPSERKVAVPLMLGVPFLFLAGVVFGYLVALPAAVTFLQNFNDENFDILLQARDYYKFAVMLLGIMGLLFQLPVVILAATRVGIVSTRQLRGNRGYALLIIAVVAAVLPGTDPITMLSMMVPMVVLYELSILLAALLDRRAARAQDAADADGEPDLPSLDDDDD
jgi:sec-independent protein translocase protein TatC